MSEHASFIANHWVGIYGEQREKEGGIEEGNEGEPAHTWRRTPSP